MGPSVFLSEPATSPGNIAILGAGPAGLVLAISLASVLRALYSQVVERRSGHCPGGPDRAATSSGRSCRSWTNIGTGWQWSSKPTWKALTLSQVH